MPESLRATIETVLRQRLAAHEHPLAVADALEAVPRSRPFDDIAELAAIDVPTVVVASRDEADPGHPLAVGERYAQAIPGAELLVEDAGPPTRSPIAWQGGQLSAAARRLSPAARVCDNVRSYARYAKWDGASYDRISGTDGGAGAPRCSTRLELPATRPCSTPAAARVASPRRCSSACRAGA